jgi:hypothetical protein
MSKLTEGDRNDMREMRKRGVKYKEIAHIFGCSVPHVANVMTGRIGANDKPTPPKPALRLNVMPGITLGQLTAGK